jgi:alkaline phosphatase D
MTKPDLLRLLSLVLLSAMLIPKSLFPQQQPIVVILSMDGFRWDYPIHAKTPNLDKLAEQGVKAKALVPSFPSITFPNHYTLATGLYPDHHGIVHNTFLDPETGLHYSIGNRKAVENEYFYGGEPLWVTAEKQGVISAAFFWVGSEAEIGGFRPTYWKKYDHDFPYAQRIDTVIHWLSLPAGERPRLVMWYYDEPDHTGHDAGPSGKATLRKVEYLDSLVGVFVKKISVLPHASQVNVIILSDHGMGPVSHEKTVYLKDYIDEAWFESIEGSSPVYNLLVKDDFRDTAWSALQRIPHTRAWKHGSVEERLCYGTHARTLDFTILTDSAWQIRAEQKNYNSKGAHGYDPANTDMHAIFYADGPAFKDGYVHPAFQNVHVYPLVCHILGIRPAVNDGDLSAVKGLLRK